MATPQGTVSLNKQQYVPGEDMFLTVDYADPDSKKIKATIILEDQNGNTAEPVVVESTIYDPVSVTVADSDRIWALVSDDGKRAVYQSKA